MNLNWKTATIAAALLSLTAGSALATAQDTKPTDPKPQDGRPQDGKPHDGRPQDGKPQDGKSQEKNPAVTDKRDAEDEVNGRVRRVTKLLDCGVKNTKGEKIGDIEALIIDKDEGCIAYAVLSFGGFLGVGEQLFAMPFTKIVRTDDETCVIADVTKASLEKAPKFASDSWPTFDRTYGKTLHEYYKASPYWDDESQTAHQDPTRIRKDALDKDNLAARGMCRAGKLVGTDVEDASGKDIGDVDEIVIDDGNGRIIYAVLSFGGFLGMGDKLFALPWQSLTQSANDADKLVLDVPKDRLKAAPGFDKKSWPDMADHRWGLDIYKYYGRAPHWDTTKDKTGAAPASR